MKNKLMIIFFGCLIVICLFSHTVNASSVATPALTRIDNIGNTYYNNAIKTNLDWKGNFKSLEYNTFNKDLFNVSGTIIDTPTKTDIEPLYIGETPEGLVNSTNEEQTIQVPSYTKSYNNTKTSTISEGANFSLGDVSIPLFSGLSINVNTSSSEPNTETETNTITSPSQAVKVPPHKTYGAKVTLNRVKYTGKFNIKATTWRNHETITANVIQRRLGLYFPSSEPRRITYPIDYAYYRTPSSFLENGIKYSSNSTSLQDAKQKYKDKTLRTTLTLEGNGEYSIEHGTTFHVEIYDMSTKMLIKKFDI